MARYLETLLAEYKTVRAADLLEAHFVYLLKIYPSLLVCMSDGKVEKAEWDGIRTLSTGLAVLYKEEQPHARKADIEKLFTQEFKYLIENIPLWEKKFLRALGRYLKEHIEEKEFVYESMYLLANTSEGISKEEQEKIELLASQLTLVH